jgi:DNA polymerase alpha subunit A
MADLLGEVDVNIPSRPDLKMKPIKSESRRKTRIISPPQDAKPPRASKEGHSNGVSESKDASFTADDRLPVDDDVLMSDPPPLSPLERRSQPVIKKEEVSDDDMEVEQAVGQSRDTAKAVNMSGVRHVNPKKPSYPGSSPPRPAVDAVDASAWTSITDNLNVLSSPAASQSTSFGKLNAEQAQEDDQSLRFFWFDYIDINGSLCLFGKVKDKTSGGFVSCFLKVDNIQRRLYFLPRKHRKSNGADTEVVNMSDVYNEVDGLMTKLRVGSYKIKPCTKKYAFELPDIPKEADYLEVLYPYDKPPLSIDLAGETFSRVFGTNTALFEQFVLQKNIMGPCWLNVKGGNFNAVTNSSWCKLEVQVGDPGSITVLADVDAMEPPPLTLMSLALRTTYDAKVGKQEILIISARVYENVALGDTNPAERLPSKPFTVMRPLGTAYPTGFKLEAQKHRGFIGMEPNESALLSKFMAILGNVDPDVIIGHKLDDVDIGVLLNRLKERKTPGWHRIGRLRRSEWPKSYGRMGGSMFVERQLVAGRLLCDLANELGKSLMAKCQSWSLSEMCELILRQSRLEIDNEQALNTWAKTREGLMQYLTHCEADTHFIAAIALKVQMLPLSKQLTTLAGNSWARTLSGTRAERNEYILLHEFHRNNYICPDKVFERRKTKTEDEENEEGADQKKKDKYKGGLVFEPEKGLYDRYILVMDFNSLYPSIIQEFNICFTTVERTSTVCLPEECSTSLTFNSLTTRNASQTSRKTRNSAYFQN